MFELVQAGGFIMWPIILCSVIAMAIIIERFWVFRSERVIPSKLVPQIWQLHQGGQITGAHIATVRDSSPLGRMLAAGLENRHSPREVMKEAIEEEGRQVVHELERYLSTLGTIAAITPLLGLLGTVIGMIKVFAAITASGVGNPSVLAGGISEALITTAAGLSVAIPALIFHRHLSSRLDKLVIGMEEQSLKLVEVMQGDRK